MKLEPVVKGMFISPPFEGAVSYCLFKSAWFWVLKHGSEYYLAIDNEDFSLEDTSFVAIQPEKDDKRKI